MKKGYAMQLDPVLASANVEIVDSKPIQNKR